MKLSYVILVLALATTACEKSENLPRYWFESGIDTTYTNGTPEGSTVNGADPEHLVENQQFTNKVTIDFGTEVAISNPLEGNGVTITNNDGIVTVTSTAAGVEYVLTGTAANAGIKLYSNDNYKVTLNSVKLTNPNGPALNLQSTAKAFVVIAENTSNELTDGTNYTIIVEPQRAALYARGDMIISGTGKLQVNAAYFYGICSDQVLRIREGNIVANSTAEDVLHATRGLIQDGGDVTLTGANNGIVVEGGYFISNRGSINMKVERVGIQAKYIGSDKSIDPFININGGQIYIKSNAGVCVSGSTLTVNNGTLNSMANTIQNDNGVSMEKDIFINGGYVFSAGKSGINAGRNITITGGVVEGIGRFVLGAGLDCPNGVLKITGGSVAAAGTFVRTPDQQLSTVHSIVLGGGGIHIAQGDGSKSIITYVGYEGYQTLLVASSRIKQNTTYNLYRTGMIADPKAPKSGVGVNLDTLNSNSRYTPVYYNNVWSAGIVKEGLYINAQPDSSFTIGADMVTHLGGTLK